MNQEVPESDESKNEELAELKRLMKCFEIEIKDAMNKIKAGKNAMIFFNNLETFQNLTKYLEKMNEKMKEQKQKKGKKRSLAVSKTISRINARYYV